jgi:hypothetical protein
MRKILDVIWGDWEQEYFSENQKKDSTRLSTNRPTGKSLAMKPAATVGAQALIDALIVEQIN